MSTITNTQNERVALRKLWWVGLLAAAMAAIANLIVFAIATGVFDVQLAVQGPGTTAPEPLTTLQVIVVDVVPAVGAIILLALLGWLTRRPILIFWIVSVVVLFLSFPGTFMQPIDLMAKIVLSVMHILAAAVIVGLLITLGRIK